LRGLLQFLVHARCRQAPAVPDINLTLMSTQREDPRSAFLLGASVNHVARRFPSKFRGTFAERIWCQTMPEADVIHGPFFHVFPHPRAARVVTVHDTSFLYPELHGDRKAARHTRVISRTLENADVVVCISRTTEQSVLDRWPQCSGKTRVIYNGVTPPDDATPRPASAHEGSLLVVGTIEPRKNYATILRAYEVLRQVRPDDCPTLSVVGRLGWMSDEIASALRRLEAAGACTWLNQANDATLWRAYAGARVFTYLPIMEGFGYPPFEAAAFGCPLVLSDRSSVGEIWRQSARCVDPLDVDSIVASWEWALDLCGQDRLDVAARQRETVRRFEWEACCREYAKVWIEAAAGSLR
jgi:glycosyltransferase involved in cell wall biosynthesis